ncbi:MAG: hypothetical protein ACOY9J_01800 [Pseudomonadota bacterium]
MQQMPRRLITFLIALLTVNAAAARNCPADGAPALVAAQFTSRVQAQKPQDRLLYLAPGTREIFIHATTLGAGKITYRWYQDGKRVIDVAANVGTGQWHTWSRLRMGAPMPEDVRVQLLGANACLLHELTLASAAFTGHPEIRKAWQQLAADDATGAKITLKLLLESATPNSPLAKAVQRMLDRDVALAQALERARAGELFLVEGTLKAVEKHLGNRPADRSARDRIVDIRREMAAQKIRLGREGNFVALATRHLLETEKLFRGDYPLWRAEADRVVTPALIYAGNTFTMIDWQPTLRGYRLLLQDKRTGSTIEVTPD